MDTYSKVHNMNVRTYKETDGSIVQVTSHESKTGHIITFTVPTGTSKSEVSKSFDTIVNSDYIKSLETKEYTKYYFVHSDKEGDHYLISVTI